MEYSFEATGVSNKETIMEIKKYLLPSFIHSMTIMIIIIFLFQSIYEMLYSSTFMSIFFILLALLLYILYRCFLVLLVNRYMQSMKGYMHTDNLVYHLSFNDEYLSVSIYEGKIYTRIPYSNFVKIIETKNLYIMKTNAGNPIILTKQSLSNISKEDWKKFLRKKCTNVKKIKLMH